MKTIKIIFASLFSLALLLQCSSQSQKTVFGNSKPVSHELWDIFVKKYVSSSGNVDYKLIKQHKSELEVYLNILASSHPSANWTNDEQKAYWINAYNAYTVSLLIDNYPVKSIKDIGGTLKSPWDKSFIVIENQSYSFGDIEHNILRKEFNDPRIHFAINCASFSCPDLLNKAYLAETLDEQLNDAAISFVNDNTKNKISSKTIEISEIFKWFSEDFTKGGTIIDYLNQYSKVKINTNANAQYISYNWSLNE